LLLLTRLWIRRWLNLWLRLRLSSSKLRTGTTLSVTSPTGFTVKSPATSLVRLKLFGRHYRSRLYVLNDRLRNLHNRQMPNRVGEDHALRQAPELRVHRSAVTALSVQFLAASKDDVLGEDRVTRQSITLDSHDTAVDRHCYDGDHA
jgi:hypothetical protein